MLLLAPPLLGLLALNGGCGFGPSGSNLDGLDAPHAVPAAAAVAGPSARPLAEPFAEPFAEALADALADALAEPRPVPPSVAKTMSAPGRTASAKIRYRGKNYAFDKLPEELGAPARAAIEQWLPWVEEHDFCPLLSADQSTLLVLPKKSLLSKREKLLEEVVERFNELAPLPGEAPREARPRHSGQDLPADALESLPGRDAETAVLVELMGPKLSEELGTYLAQLHPDLRGWASTSLIGGVLSDGQEEYEPENEVVHRLTRTLLARRFGLLPYTVQAGLAWALEEELCGDHYCFPFRDDFIFATEHGAWSADLKARFHSRRKEPLTAQELFEFRRGTFELEPAQAAFGLGRYLIEERPEDLPKLLEALRKEWERTVIRIDGSNWSYHPDQTIAPARVAEVCAEVLGDDFAQVLTDYFRKGLR